MNITDPELKERRRSLFKQEAEESIQKIIEALEDAGYKRFTLAKVAAVASAVPNSLMLGIPNAIVNAFDNFDIPNYDPRFAYAAFAERDLLKPSYQNS